MRKKKLFIVVFLSIILFPLNIKALNIEKNWNSYTEILPSGVVGKEYSFNLESTENDLSEYRDSYTLKSLDSNFKYSADSASLPDGITITEDGLISGTFTKSGKYSFYVSCKRGIAGMDTYYGIRSLSTLFTIYVYENDIDYNNEIVVNNNENLGIFDKTFNKITNDGNLSIIRSSSTYNGEGYTINNSENVYIYDTSFVQGKSVINNTDNMILDNVSFHYNESDDYIINNSKDLYLNNISFSGNKSSKYAIYNSSNIYLTGYLNTTLLNDSDYEKDNIYLDTLGKFYFDITNGNATLSDFSKLQGSYINNLNVILSKDMDNSKEYVLIENYDTKYKVNDGLIKYKLITKFEPRINFVTTENSFNKTNTIATISIIRRFFYI